MGIKSTGILDSSGIVTNSTTPILLGARLILAEDNNYLEIYDNELGPESGKVIAYLDKDHPFIMFDKLDVFRCNEGLYAFLPVGGKYIIYYDV